MADTVVSLLIEAKEQVSKELKKVEGSLKSVQSAALKVGGSILGAIGVGKIVGGIIETNKQFDKLEARLSTFTSTAAEAAAAMDVIQQFTSTTPFQLQEVTEAYTMMLSRGLVPTREALKAFGDVAAATGNNITEFAQAAGNAVTGEFDSLKRFGITAKKEGDNVSITFKGMTQVVKNNAAEIQKALVDIGQTNFAGGMERQMNTMEGAISNMQDNLANVARAIGEAGLNEAIMSIAMWFGDLAKWVTQHTGEIQSVWIQAGGNILKTFRTIAYVGEQAFNGLDIIVRGVIDSIALAWNKFMSALVKSYNAVADIIPGMDKLSETAGQLNYTSDQAIDRARKATEAYQSEMKAIDETTQARLASIEWKKKEVLTADELEKKQLAEQAAAIAAEEARRKQLATEKELEKQRKKSLEDEKRGTENFKEFIVNLDKATRANEYYVKGKEKDLELTEALEDAAKARGKALSEEEKQLVKNAVAAKQASDATKKAYDEAAEKAKEAAERSLEFWKEAARGMQNAMSDFFFDAMQGRMNDLAGSFKTMIDRMVADFLSSQLLSFLLGDFGGTGKIGGKLGSMFRAAGGPVTAGQPYIVGERGPEMIVPRFSGTVLNAGDTAKALGSGGGNNVSINITAMDSQDVRRALEKDRRWLAELIGGTQNTFNMRTV